MRQAAPLLLAALFAGCASIKRAPHAIAHVPAATSAAVRDVILPLKGIPFTTRNSALIFPGGGWLYLDNAERTRDYQNTKMTYPVSPSVPFIIVTGVLAGVLANNLSHNNHGAALAAGAGLVVVRFADILTSVRQAKWAYPTGEPAQEKK